MKKAPRKVAPHPVAPAPARQAPGVLDRLGELPVSRFLTQYWHRRPLMVRRAIAGFESTLSAQDVRALAAHDSVEARLVTRRDGDWQVRHGPFGPRALPALTRPDWTVLVNGVDLQVPAVAALARRFRFLPGVRFDDVMISVAGDGGGVGPHIDQYDVFLLQAWGRRRWRISRQRDTECVPGLPLRILADFRAEEEWDLGPGDLLYLPPGVAHEGVAQGPCMTISIGFRLPSWQSLAETWYEQQGEFSPLKGRLPGQVPGQGRNAGELPASFIPALLQALRRRQPGPQDARRALLANLSEPRPHVYFEPPQAPVSQAQFARSLARQGAHLDLRSRLFYSARMAGINGEACALSPAQLRAVKPLADQGYLPGHAVPQDKGLPDEDVLDLLYGWYCDGWLCMGAPSATA